MKYFHKILIIACFLSAIVYMKYFHAILRIIIIISNNNDHFVLIS
jgi:hypothetical protein